MGERGPSRASWEDPGGPRPALVRRLGQDPVLQGEGRLAELDALARSGLPVPEGVMISPRAHEEFLRGSGLLAEVRFRAARTLSGEIRRQVAVLRRAYAAAPIGAALQDPIIGALIDLGARSVRVLSDHGERRGLDTLPDVRDAIRDVWLSTTGLERQVRAATASEAPPTWPVLIQREAQPEHVGWTRVGGEDAGVLRDVRPADASSPARRTVAELALEAGVTLDGPARLHLGLEEGAWYVLGVEHE